MPQSCNWQGWGVADQRSDVAPEVVAAFADYPPAQRAALLDTWALAVATLQGAEQCIAWGMPTLRVDGDLVMSLSGFSEHNSVFPGPGVIERLGAALSGLTVTKGTIHFERDSSMKRSLLKAILRARIEEINESYPRANGQFKEFYPNGFLKARGKHKAGRLQGAWEWFRRDGTIKRSGRFNDDVQVGVWVTYDADGRPYKETSFD